jgi:putative restriction endonuclease
MSKVIFTTKASSIYDDRPEEYYHFPSTYLNQVRGALGDHMIYYEPRRLSIADSSRGGRQAYFATARVKEIVEDQSRSDHYYAIISDFLSFDRPVPFADGRRYYESALSKEDGSTNKGAFGRAVRAIPEMEFDQILKVGFAQELDHLHGHSNDSLTGFEDPPHRFERPIVEMTVSRPFRDQAFKRAVRTAYQNRCALTGLCLVNGGGRPEVQAAHIMPVTDNGPDSIRNGLALSGTLHWLFDRGLIAVDDDHKILIAKNKIPDQILKLLNPDGKIITPKDFSYWPHPYYLRYHREHTFKG